MGILVRRRRLLWIPVIALAVALIGGCSQRWSLEVTNRYSKPVRIYCDSVHQVPRTTKLLGELSPSATARFEYILDPQRKWHIIVRDKGEKTLQNIWVDAEAVRAAAIRAHGGEHVWRLTVAPKPKPHAGTKARVPGIPTRPPAKAHP